MVRNNLPRGSFSKKFAFLLYMTTKLIMDLDLNLAYHLSLLKIDDSDDRDDDIMLAPIFTGPVLNHSDHRPSQFGLLGGLKKLEAPGFISRKQVFEKDPRLFFNVSSPSSTFICGSQGSGKSHTLSCILEGCLIPSKAGRLSNPLTAVVFHYDTFICDSGGSPCEAAFLASHSQINARVLCAPTNIRTIQVIRLRSQNVIVSNIYFRGPTQGSTLKWSLYR